MGKSSDIALFISLVVILLSGCNKNTVDINEFLNIDTPGLIVKGKNVMTYDERTCQIGYNESQNLFSIFEDSFSNYAVIKCSSAPVLGETLTADVQYTTVDNVKHLKNVHFKVSKIDDAVSLIWLYSEKNDVCAVVQTVR